MEYYITIYFKYCRVKVQLTLVFTYLFIKDFDYSGWIYLTLPPGSAANATAGPHCVPGHYQTSLLTPPLAVSSASAANATAGPHAFLSHACHHHHHLYCSIFWRLIPDIDYGLK